MHAPRGIQGVVRVTYQEGWVDTELHQGGARVADQEGWLTQSWSWKHVSANREYGFAGSFEKAVIMVGLMT